jgi:hypothetical protein
MTLALASKLEQGWSMPQANFSLIERRAIWEAYNKRCAYCDGALSFRSLEIDHVVPQSADEAVFRSLELSPTYDVHSTSNLVASCRACNSKKRDRALLVRQLAIVLAMSAERASVVEALKVKFREQGTREKYVLGLSTALANGTISQRDVFAAIEAINVNNPVKLSSPICGLGGDSIFEISKDDIDNLLVTSIDVNGEKGGRLRLVNDADHETFVDTLDAYKNATDVGFYARTNAEMKCAAAYFEYPLSILNLIQKACIAEITYLSTPHVSINDLRFVPASILMVGVGPDEDMPRVQKDSSVLDLVRSGEATIVESSTGVVRIRCYDHETYMFEVFRADVDDDGIEELVIFWVGYPTRGSLRVSEVKVLSRKKEDVMFEEISG